MLSALLCLSMSAGSVYLPPEMYLVRATTIEVRGGDRTYPHATFRITHVYSGPEELKNRTFTHQQKPFLRRPTPLDNPVHIWPLEKNVEGLWWIRPDGKGGYEVEDRGEVVDPYYLRRFPYQDRPIAREWPNGRAYWEEGLAWAEAVEKVTRAADDAERGRLLRDYAAERSPVGTWAITLLIDSKEKETVALLRELATDDKLPLPSQAALDQTLLALEHAIPNTSKWQYTKERNELWQRRRDLQKAGSPRITREFEDMVDGW